MLMNMKIKLGVAICALFLAPGLLLAEAKTHDGFFLNLGYGFGSGSVTSEPKEGEDSEFSGSMRVFYLKIGGSINPNWSIHYNASAIGASADTPESVKQYGYDNTTYVVAARGIGATYYFVSDNPYLSNLYISPEYRFEAAAVLRSERKQANRIFTTTEDNTYSGSGFGLTVGKEWWLSPDWGIGLALFYHSDSLDGDKYTNSDNVKFELESSAKVNHFGFLFSATYN